MVVEVLFIDKRGMMSIDWAPSKGAVVKWLAGLEKGIEASWLRRNQILVSQQYLVRKKGIEDV